MYPYNDLQSSAMVWIFQYKFYFDAAGNCQFGRQEKDVLERKGVRFDSEAKNTQYNHSKYVIRTLHRHCDTWVRNSSIHVHEVGTQVVYIYTLRVMG